MPTFSSNMSSNPYRSQHCAALRSSQKGEKVRLSGWISRKRNHGRLLFVDLRDSWGITQCVLELNISPPSYIDASSNQHPVLTVREDKEDITRSGVKGQVDWEQAENLGSVSSSERIALLEDMIANTDSNSERLQVELFLKMEKLGLESVISVEGQVRARSAETVNQNLPTGDAELAVSSIDILSQAAPLPIPVNRDADYPEDLRLKYRFLDLRRESMRKKILLRSNVIASLRSRMMKAGFTEFQTPILTASSPEGARDFLVPSRLQPHKFYALPQAPQQFKQLLMIAGFERYFQIAPCFRDEDARSDRSPGEFYQLDFEMAFATQEEIMNTLEAVLSGTFVEFSNGRMVTSSPFPRISYADALLRYGTDKPDLRNPIVICDVSDLFADSAFTTFAHAVANGACVRALRAPGASSKPRSFFDKLNDWSRSEGQKGLGYIAYPKLEDPQGPIARNISSELSMALAKRADIKDGDALFFVCAEKKSAESFSALVRQRLAEACACIADNSFEFCWVVDFPMYERDETSGEIVFSHNPFSMPQGGMEALTGQDPLTIVASQYDIVCNGVELSSGALRNHDLATLERAFEIAGYSNRDLEERFPGMFSALRYGVPPHGGAAPGIERIVMLLAGETNIREITCFPLTQMGQDILMGAPSTASADQLQALGLRLLDLEKKE